MLMVFLVRFALEKGDLFENNVLLDFGHPDNSLFARIPYEPERKQWTRLGGSRSHSRPSHRKVCCCFPRVEVTASQTELCWTQCLRRPRYKASLVRVAQLKPCGTLIHVHSAHPHTYTNIPCIKRPRVSQGITRRNPHPLK